MSAAQPKIQEPADASEAAKAVEPSMEEILASIRRIIADEQGSAANETPAKPEPEPVPESAAEDDVVDLATVVTHTPRAADVGPVAADDLDFVPEGTQSFGDIEARIPMEAMEEPSIQMPPPPPLPEPNFDIPDTPLPPPSPRPAPAAEAPAEPLLSHAADTAIASAFSNLSHTILSQNARTLDDLVKEMLRPMLKSWLDDNLPGLVERLVRAEIERVARGGR